MTDNEAWDILKQALDYCNFSRSGKQFDALRKLKGSIVVLNIIKRIGGLNWYSAVELCDTYNDFNKINPRILTEIEFDLLKEYFND